MKKAFKISLIVIGAFFVLLLLVSFLTGPIAKNYVQKHDKELIGREVSIGKLNVNLFTGKLKIKDLTLFEDDGATPFVSFESFETKIRWRDLFNHRLWVKKATLSGLNVNVEQNREWFNFTSLLEQFASDSTKNESSSFGLILNDICLEKGSFQYTDLALANELQLRDISLLLPSIDFSEMKTDIGLDLSLSDNAVLHTDLHLSDNGKKYFINLKIDSLGIEVIEPYLQQYYPVDLLQGLADLDLEIEGPTEHIMDFDLNGHFTLNNIALRDTVGSPLGTIDSVFAEIKCLRLNDKILDFDRLHLFGLKSQYIVNADSNSNFDLVLDSYFHSDSTDITHETDTILVDDVEHKSWQVSIADLNLDQAEVVFEDNTLPTLFHYEISDIHLTSKHFSRQGINTIQMQAALNKMGKLHMNWQGSFLGHDNHNLTLMLSNINLLISRPIRYSCLVYPWKKGPCRFEAKTSFRRGSSKASTNCRSPIQNWVIG